VNINAKPASVRALHIRIQKGSEWSAEMRQRVRQIPEAYKQEVGKLLGEMLDLGVIERVAESEFYSQLLVVRKKDGSLRLCVDFRSLNALTVRNRYPLPLIRELVAKLKGKKVLGVLDLASGYWQAPLAEDSKKYTVFATTEGLFQFTRVAFGLCNAPSYFQEVIQNEVLGHLRDAAIVYIDDILIFGEDEDEFLRNLDRVLEALEKHGIVVKPQKCRLGLASVEYVGLKISGETVDMTEERKMAIAGIPRPVTVTQLRTFLGIVNYFRSHIPKYAHITAGLYAMIAGQDGKRAKHDQLVWDVQLDKEFLEVKGAAAGAETLYHFEEGLEIILRTDASDFAVGGVLTQLDGKEERPILFLSKKLSKTQRNYSVSDKEMVAIFFCIKSAHQLLAGRTFTVYSDHRPLESNRSSASPRIERMKIALQEYDFVIKYLKGAENESADLMSRLMVMHSSEGEEKNRLKVIADHHNGFTGHLGRDATVQEIRSAGHDWPGLREDVAEFVKECLVCQRGRSARGLRHGQLFLEARAPGQEWGIDAMELENVAGFKFVLVVVCHFTRFVHLAPLRSVSSKDCQTVMEKLFLTFGRPDVIRTDNAKNFKSELIADLLERYDIRAVDIPPYDSRSNAIVERAIQEVRRHLYAVRAESGMTWPQALPRVQFIMNRKKHIATGYAPADLLFGRLGALGYGEMEGSIRRARSDGERWLLDEEEGTASETNQATEEAGNEEEERTMEQGSSDAGGQDDVVVPEEIGRAQGTQGGDNMDTGSVGEVEEAGEERERGGVEYIAESERERARVAREQEELVATAMAQQQARAMRRSADRNKEVELKPGDRVWVKTRSTKRNSKREFWEGPETVIERRGDIVVVTGAEREQTLAISKLRRAGGNLREGGEISEIVDHQPYQPGLNLDRYKLKVRLVGDKNVHWRQASELVDHVLFHRYALDFQDLTHLIEEEAEGC
jgi:transposase InsO family protein